MQTLNFENKLSGITISSVIMLADVFKNERHSYVCELKLFTTLFNTIPNYINQRKIDCEKANEWFCERYYNEFKDSFYSRMNVKGESERTEYDDMIYFIDEDLLVCFDNNQSTVRYLFKKTNIAIINNLIEEIEKFKKRYRVNRNRISLLINSYTGIETYGLKIRKQKISINDNYNDDFKPIHETIIRRLSKKNDKGLVILHGKPGTGKTSYIRHLVSLTRKQIIYLPPDLATSITNPELMTMLLENPNSILVIEDAENIVIDRESNSNSPVSALLNISDGLLSDCLNIQLICSFNTDITKVDNALLRKGRLIAKYEFKALSISKAQALANKLNIQIEVTQEMTLSDIYNTTETNYSNKIERAPIGFIKPNYA